jgi:tight adherence protein C
MLMASGLLFLAVMLGVLGLTTLLGERGVRRRLERLADSSVATIEIEGVAAAGSTTDPFGQALTRIGERFGRKRSGRLRQRLVEAGYRRPSALPRFLGVQLVLASGLPGLLLLAPGIWSLGYGRLVGALSAACAIGFVFPSYLLDKRRNHRRTEIDHGLPDALDLMVVCVEAGLGLTASLTRVAREFARTNPVLSSEFELVHLECRAGKGTTDALRSMAERTNVPDLRSLVAMLIQTERFGTSLADSLRIHADGMRVKRLQRAEEAAQKAPVKMLFPAALFIFPATLIVTIGPGLITLFGFFKDKAS